MLLCRLPNIGPHALPWHYALAYVSTPPPSYSPRRHIWKWAVEPPGYHVTASFPISVLTCPRDNTAAQIAVLRSAHVPARHLT